MSNGIYCNFFKEEEDFSNKLKEINKLLIVTNEEIVQREQWRQEGQDALNRLSIIIKELKDIKKLKN